MSDMLSIELVPTLSQCIETAARKRYDETLRQLLASGEQNKKLLETAALLKNFLETADFRKLRVESEALLTQGREVKFVLRLDGGILQYDMRPLQD